MLGRESQEGSWDMPLGDGGHPLGNIQHWGAGTPKFAAEKFFHAAF